VKVVSLEVEGKILETKVEKLEKENSLLRAECNQVMFAWEIQNFDSTKAFYISSEFQAFGHTLYLQFKKYNDDDYYGLYLGMRTRVHSQLGFKFIVGRYDADQNSEYVKTYASRVLSDYSSNSYWSWGSGKIASVSELITQKLLTSEGALQIKAVVYKAIHN
jgi:hypothetical protein